MTNPTKTVRVASPAGLLSVVPALLGFEPADSMVVVGVTGERDRVHVTLRYDLPGTSAEIADFAAHALAVLSSQPVTAVVAVGYGTSQAVDPVAVALRESAGDAGLAVREILRVEGGRYWSYCCGDDQCCARDGVPFQPGADVAGEPVLTSRAAVAATVAPVTGEQAESMRQATRHATDARQDIQADLAGTRSAIETCRNGGQVSDAEAARITVALASLRVRDDAWARMDPEHRAEHITLWTDLTRRAQPGYVAAPASLLTFCAWQDGNGALANVAMDRALADDPRYSMALLLRQVITAGAPPSLARLPMSPEEVAASYDETE